MICPNCGLDYKDVKPGKMPGFVHKVDDHFYKRYKRFAMYCTNCGFVAEWIAKPTGACYLKREMDDDRKSSLRHSKRRQESDVRQKKA